MTYIDNNYGKLTIDQYKMAADSILLIVSDCPSCTSQLFEAWEYAAYQFRYQKNFIHQKEALDQLKLAFDKLELKDRTTQFYKYLIYHIRLAHYYDNINDLVQGEKIYNHIVDTISYDNYYNRDIHEIKNLALQSLSSIEQKRGNTHKAISYLNYCIEDEIEMANKKGRKPIVWSIYAKLGGLYQEIDDNKLAAYNYQKTNDHIKIYLDTVSDSRLKKYAGQFFNRIISYAEFCLENKDLEAVRDQVAILDHLPIPDNNPRKIRLQLLKASYFSLVSAIDSSDYYMNWADKSLSDHPSETVQRANWYLTKSKQFYTNRNYQKCINWISKGYTYTKKYEANGYLSEVYWDLKHLQVKALENLGENEILLELIKSVQVDISKRLASDMLFKDHITSVYDFYPILEKGLALIYDAPVKDYELAYDIIENIKSINLYKKFNTSSLYRSANDNIISNYKLQKAVLTQLKLKKVHGDTTSVLSNEIFEKSQLLEKTEIELKENLSSSGFPKDMVDLQNYSESLDKGICHILVFAGIDHYYFLSIDRENTTIHRCSTEAIDTLSLQVSEHISNLSYQPIDNESSLKLYELLTPIYPTNTKNLIISNDGNLNLVPFEALIDKDKRYLVEYLNIHYVPSAKLRYTLRTNPATTNPSALVIAPDNSNNNSIGLKYALEESQAIQHITEGTIYENENASLKNFKSNCESFDIIHLATHAVSNNNAADQSYIQFSTIHDLIPSKLYFDEISSLILDAQMVCLSACQTATGHINLAEGMRSLSNEFLAAGSSSVVSTLWSIPDQTTSNIMQHFYKELYKGQEKSVALSIAKRTYLQNAMEEERNPYYWSGIVLTGSSQAIVSNSTNNYFYYILIGLLIIISLVWKYKS